MHKALAGNTGAPAAPSPLPRPGFSWAARGFLAGLALLLAAAPWGCVKMPAPPTSSPEGPVEITKPQGKGTSESYYNYMMSQIMWNSRNLDAASAYLDRAIVQDPDVILLRQDLIRIHMERGDYEQALKEARLLAARHPQDVEAHLTLGSIYFSQNLTTEAIDVYQKVLEMDPGQTEVYFILGELFQKNRENPKAIQAYEKLIQKDPQSFSAWYFLGKAHFQEGDFQEAARCFEQTLAIKPGLDQVTANLIEAYDYLEEDGKVVELYEQMAAKNPADVFPPLGLADFYLRRKQPKKAREVLDKARVTHANDPLFERKTARVYLDRKYFQEAADIFSALHAINPRDDEIIYFYAVTQEGMENLDQAVALYRKITPDSTYYQMAQVDIAFLTSDPDDALRALALVEKSNAGQPMDADLAMTLASLHERAGHAQTALDILNSMLEKEPGNIRLLFTLGTLYDKQDKKLECIEIMKKVLELNPEDPQALNYLGYTYADMGIRLEEAKTLVEKALEIAPDDGFITDSLGWVYFKMGDYKNALTYLLKAVDLAPQDPVIKEHLGDAYLKNGNIPAALEAYRQSLPARAKRGDDTAELEQKIKSLDQ